MDTGNILGMASRNLSRRGPLTTAPPCSCRHITLSTPSTAPCPHLQLRKKSINMASLIYPRSKSYNVHTTCTSLCRTDTFTRPRTDTVFVPRPESEPLLTAFSPQVCPARTVQVADSQALALFGQDVLQQRHSNFTSGQVPRFGSTTSKRVDENWPGLIVANDITS